MFNKIIKIAAITGLVSGLVFDFAQGQNSPAQNNQDQSQVRRTIIEDRPASSEFFTKAGSETHSGLPVPRYVSLKFGKVNGRKGPSLEHPILWQFQRKGLPLIVVAETDNWRKVRDSQGEESWVRRVALSGVLMALTRQEVDIMTRPREDARISAVAQPNVLLQLGKCNDAHWCKVKSSEGYKGWVRRRHLWGAQSF